MLPQNSMNKFFTIGYGNRTPAEFINALQAHGVKTVVDVRIRPDRARLGCYVKAKTPDKGIAKLLAAAGINYQSFPELGNPFRDVEDWVEPFCRLFESDGSKLTERLVRLVGTGEIVQPLCLLCAEKKPQDCHRTLVADWLVRNLGWEAMQIV